MRPPPATCTSIDGQLDGPATLCSRSSGKRYQRRRPSARRLRSRSTNAALRMGCCLKWTSINNCDINPERMGMAVPSSDEGTRLASVRWLPAASFDSTADPHQISNTVFQTHGTREVVIDRSRKRDYTEKWMEVPVLRPTGGRSALQRRMAARCREGVSGPPQLHPSGAGRTRSLCLEVAANGEASRQSAAPALSAPE